MVLPATSRIVKNTALRMADHDRADVAGLLGEAFDEGLLGLGLRFRRRVREDRVDALGDVFGVLRIVDADVVPAHLSLSAAAHLVEVVVAEEEVRRVGLFGEPS